MFRKFAVFIAGTSLAVMLLLAAGGISATATFNAKNLKGWIDKSGIYQTFVDDVIQSSSTALAKNQGEQDLALSQPGVRAAADKAFSPAFLQNATEQIIDGTSNWLNGKTSKPQFAIKVEAAKAEFADALGTYALKRYNALPACRPGQIPDTANVLSISCRIPGVDIRPELNQQIAQVKNSKDFLATPVITADSVTAGNNGVPVYQRVQHLPVLYRIVRIAPFVFGLLAIAAIAIIVFFSTDRRQGLRRVLVSLATVSGILLASMWLNKLALNAASRRISDNTNGSFHNLQAAFLDIAEQARLALNRWHLLFAILLGLVAAGIALYLYLTRRRPQQKTPDAGNPPQQTMPHAKAD